MSIITTGSSPITTASCPAGTRCTRPGTRSRTSPSSISTRIWPEITTPRWATWQLPVFAIGPMWVDQRQPGWVIERDANRSPTRTKSSWIPGSSRCSSGSSKLCDRGRTAVHRRPSSQDHRPVVRRAYRLPSPGPPGSPPAGTLVDGSVPLERQDRLLHPQELVVLRAQRLLDRQRAFGDLGQVLERLLAGRDEALVLLLLEIGLGGRVLEGRAIVSRGAVACQQDERRGVGRLGAERQVQEDERIRIERLRQEIDVGRPASTRRSPSGR